MLGLLQLFRGRLPGGRGEGDALQGLMLVADFAVGAAIEQENLGSWALSYGLSQALHGAWSSANGCVPGMPCTACDAGRVLSSLLAGRPHMRIQLEPQQALVMVGATCKGKVSCALQTQAAFTARLVK